MAAGDDIIGSGAASTITKMAQMRWQETGGHTFSSSEE